MKLNIDSNNFMKALTFTLKWEGGLNDIKGDRGGITNWGLSDAADGSIDGMYYGKPIKDLTKEDAINAYWNRYWKASGCDKKALPEAIALFDASVNCGVKRGIRFAKGDVGWSIMVDRRVDYYVQLVKGNNDFQKFFKGWINRCVDLRKYCEIIENDSTDSSTTYKSEFRSK